MRRPRYAKAMSKVSISHVCAWLVVLSKLVVTHASSSRGRSLRGIKKSKQIADLKALAVARAKVDDASHTKVILLADSFTDGTYML